jgi:hypothetical protein
VSSWPIGMGDRVSVDWENERRMPCMATQVIPTYEH